MGDDDEEFTHVFSRLPDEPEPICFVVMRDPTSDVNSLRVCPALNTGAAVFEDEWEADPFFLNGLTAILCAEKLDEYELSYTHELTLQNVNRALGTEFTDVQNMWFPAHLRPGAPEDLFSSKHRPSGWAHWLKRVPGLDRDDHNHLIDGVPFRARAFMAPGLKPGPSSRLLQMLIAS